MDINVHSLFINASVCAILYNYEYLYSLNSMENIFLSRCSRILFHPPVYITFGVSLLNRGVLCVHGEKETKMHKMRVIRETE